MKTLFENIEIFSHEGRMVKFVEHNGRKFKIYVAISNGDCVGFNHKCCLSVMAADGDFKEVVDNRQIGVYYSNDYLIPGPVMIERMKKSVSGFESFIKKLY